MALGARSTQGIFVSPRTIAKSRIGRLRSRRLPPPRTQSPPIVFVVVVIACCVNAQSAILRLFLAIRIFLVLTARPKPFSSCCWKPTKIEDCTEGLNKLALELEELRVLSQAVKKVVPVWKP